jgi:hypothetical protein
MTKKKDSKFTKGHQRGIVSERDTPLDRRALQVNLPVGLRDRIMAIDGWRDEIRIMLSQWIEGKEGGGPDKSP